MQENKEYIGRFDALFEQFLVFSIVTPVFLLLIYLFQHTVVKIDVEEYINWFSYVIVGFSGLFYSFILFIFVKEKTKARFYICFIFFYIVFIGFICYVFGQLNVPYMVLPMIIAQFFIEALFNEVFVMHQVFVDHWEGKTGKDLETHLYHNNVEAGELGASLKNFETALTIISIIFFLLTFFVYIGHISLSSFILINMLVFVSSVYFGFYKLSYFRKEAYYANIGFTNLVKDKRRYLKSIWIILILSFVLGSLVSRNQALIKINLPDEIERVYEPKQKYTDPTTEYEFVDSKEYDLEDMLGEYQESWIVELIFKILKIAAIVFLVVVLTIYLFRPFFSSGWKNFWKENKLHDYFKKLLEDIKEFFRILFAKSPEKFATVEAKTFKSSISDFLRNSKKSKEKKLELDRLTKRFMEIINWGTKKEVLYKKNMAPAEYTKLLQEYADKLALEVVGNLFEKALYDKNLLTPQEEKEYSEAIDNVLKGLE